tara:strand:- start:220644 stop:221480 length:837 start_codon:yes stop_codon:yes gene_type:complete
MPEASKRTTEHAARKAPGSRKPAHGATRKRRDEQPQPRMPSVWPNRLMILVAALAVVFAGAKAYQTLEAIPVQRIAVTGELEYTQTEAVQTMVRPALAGGFLRADLQRIREQLEALPWIYEASVRRRWPNALEIHVVEQLPIARWGEDGFLNHEGEVFRSGKRGQWQSLPLLKGPAGSAKPLVARYQRLVEMLSPLGLSVQTLAVDERNQIEAELTGGMRLVFGGSEFVERMQRFVAIYRSDLAARGDEMVRVDLRYETGVAVAFREAVAEPSQVAGL